MSTKKIVHCPSCDTEISLYNNPVPTVDIIIEIDNRIVLIERKNYPFGWALPGGFVDYGERTETAALREASEETGLTCMIVHLLGVYSDPSRDPRSHTISTVYVAKADGIPEAGDDAAAADLFIPDRIPDNMAFDHQEILSDYLNWKQQSQRYGS